MTRQEKIELTIRILELLVAVLSIVLPFLL